MIGMEGRNNVWRCGCIVVFKTQKFVALSTTEALSTMEAEYVELSDVLNEVLFLREGWRFMVPQAGMPRIPVFEENQGAFQLAHNPITNSNSTHVDVRHHLFWELVGKNRNIGYLYTIPISECGFLDEGVNRRIILVSPSFCDEFVQRVVLL